jgi:hypothetical protein
MRLAQIALICVGTLVVAVPLALFFYAQVRNPQVVQDLRQNPTGARADQVMLITLPSGRELPVNYLREGERIYAGADGRWWKELGDGDALVRVWVRGAEYDARARAVVDDPAYTKGVFSRLRPTAVPGFGTLIEIRLNPLDKGGPIIAEETR